eukprot:3586852-Pyramimonas_sp.AAC.1
MAVLFVRGAGGDHGAHGRQRGGAVRVFEGARPGGGGAAAAPRGGGARGQRRPRHRHELPPPAPPRARPGRHQVCTTHTIASSQGGVCEVLPAAGGARAVPQTAGGGDVVAGGARARGRQEWRLCQHPLGLRAVGACSKVVLSRRLSRRSII